MTGRVAHPFRFLYPSRRNRVAHPFRPVLAEGGEYKLSIASVVQLLNAFLDSAWQFD